jgi:acyl-[acyl carrier protein]--UDP-N-acetylglucosamine O-acyltransferase
MGQSVIHPTAIVDSRAQIGEVKDLTPQMGRGRI